MSSTELLHDPQTTDTDEPEVAHIAPAADVSRAYVTGEAIRVKAAREVGTRLDMGGLPLRHVADDRQ